MTTPVGIWQTILFIDDILGWIATKEMKDQRKKLLENKKHRIFNTDPYWVMPYAIKIGDRSLYNAKRQEIEKTIHPSVLKWFDAQWPQEEIQMDQKKRCYIL